MIAHPPTGRIHRSANTRPERMLRAALADRSVDFLTNPLWLVGRPDIVLPAAGLAVFVDGCFWHRCPKHWKAPKSDVDRWTARAKRFVSRDAWVARELRAAGWAIMRVWEHDLTTAKKASIAATRVMATAERLRKQRGRTWAMPDREPGQLPLGT